MQITRRAALLGLSAAFAAGPCSLALAAAGTEKRFVVVLLRGALDGLAAVVPHGDPALVQHRAGLIPPPQGPDALLDLGGFYGLHPALAGLHTLYAAGECLPIHAVAGAWRTRSHFDAQDLLECGAARRLASGWLNRTVESLPARPAAEGNAVALGTGIPLLLRGPAMVGNYAPDAAERPQPDLYARIAALNAQDRLTGRAIAEGLAARAFANTTLGGPEKPPPGQDAFAHFCAAAGRLLAAPDGPRIAALELGGWDTHADQANRLRTPLRQLDAGLVALKQNLGAAWLQTVVLVTTEFGRTVRMNGTTGTDHGTASVAFLLGGRVAGGRVGGAWPGLAPAALFENRDLAPTTDFSGVAKGILSAHLGLAPAALANVFPGSENVAPMSGVLRA
jgi:uncharacterized protein (DUF1501 family)